MYKVMYILEQGQKMSWMQAKFQNDKLWRISIKNLFTNKSYTTKHLYNIYTMLVQRRRRWTNIV